MSVSIAHITHEFRNVELNAARSVTAPVNKKAKNILTPHDESLQLIRDHMYISDITITGKFYKDAFDKVTWDVILPNLQMYNLLFNDTKGDYHIFKITPFKSANENTINHDFFTICYPRPNEKTNKKVYYKIYLKLNSLTAQNFSLHTINKGTGRNIIQIFSVPTTAAAGARGARKSTNHKPKNGKAAAVGRGGAGGASGSGAGPSNPPTEVIDLVSDDSDEEEIAPLPTTLNTDIATVLKTPTTRDDFNNEKDKQTFDTTGMQIIEIFGTDLKDTNCSVCRENISFEDDGENGKPVKFPQVRNRNNALECGHVFHSRCISGALIQPVPPTQFHAGNPYCSLICPMCRHIFGIRFGNMPANGTMTVKLFQNGLLKDSPEVKLALSNLSNVTLVDNPIWNDAKLAIRDVATNQISFPNEPTFVITFEFPDGQYLVNQINTSYTGNSRTVYLPGSRTGADIVDKVQIAWFRRILFTIGYSQTNHVNHTVIWSGIHFKTSLIPHAHHGYPDPAHLWNIRQELQNAGVDCGIGI